MPCGNSQRHILVVDDEEPVRALLRDCFELEGYVVTEAATAGEALSRLSGSTPHLVTLDLNLGGDDGLELARRIRAQCNVPIVMITGKGDTIDRVVGLELGADDYIAKPFHVREVLARIRAVLRRYDGGGTAESATPAPTSGEAYAFEGFTLDIARRELRLRSGELRELTTAEFNMLAMFVKRPSRVLSRDNIMDLLKGHDWSPLDRSIDSLVARLRRKIEESPDTPRLIKTVRGVGYVFAVDVARP
ncbi:MAG: response regulator [Hyphomicrobiaceae bacterium]|nr:response regulator [Hyphomicrobiaceae bacterium]